MDIMTSFTRPIKPLILMISSVLLLSSCASSVYKAPILQGHPLDDKAVATLHKGMTQDAVKTLLGEPTLVNPLYNNKWAYIYTEKYGYNHDTQKTLALTFTHDKLSKIVHVNE